MIDFQEKLQLNDISEEAIQKLADFYQTNPDEIKERLKKIKGYVYTPIDDVDEFLYQQSKVWKSHFLLEFLLEIGFTVKQDLFQTDIIKQKVLYYDHAKFFERYVVEWDKAKKLIDHIEKVDDEEIVTLHENKGLEYSKVMDVYRDDFQKITSFVRKNIWIYNKFMSRFYKELVNEYPDQPFCQSLHMEYSKKQYWNDENLVSKIDPNQVISTMINGFCEEIEYMPEGAIKGTIIQERIKYLNTCYHLDINSIDEYLDNPIYLAYTPSRNVVLEIKSLLNDCNDNYQIQRFLIDPYIKSFKPYIIDELRKHTFKATSVNDLFLNPKVDGFCDIEASDIQVFFFVKPLKTTNPSMIALHEFLHALEVSEYQDLSNEKKIKCGLSLEQKNDKTCMLHYDLVNEVFHQLSTEELYQKLLEVKITLFGNLDYGNRPQATSYQNYYILLKPFYQKYKERLHDVKFHDVEKMQKLFQEFSFQDYYEINNILNECYFENHFNFQQMKEKRKQYYIKKMKRYTEK